MVRLILTRAIAVALMSGVALSAQTRQDQPLKVVPAPVLTPRMRVDFGLKEAMKTLPQDVWRTVKPRTQNIPFPMAPSPATAPAPVDCAMVKTPRHEFLAPTIRIIPPPTGVTHHLKLVTVSPCPSR